MSTFMLKPTNFNFTPVSNIFIEKYMPKARGEFIKVYLLMLKHTTSGEPGINGTILASTLNLLESDIMNALNEGKLTSLEQQQMVAYLISQLCELMDGTIDREYEHLKKIDELEREVKRLHRINALHKAQLRK